jgi:hypothetical protein
VAHVHHQPRALQVVALACLGLNVATTPSREFKSVMPRRRITTVSARRTRYLSTSPQQRNRESGGLFIPRLP